MFKTRESLPCSLSSTLFNPGPPQELRSSTKHTSTAIKIRWKEPAVNPKAACAYNVQIRRSTKKPQEWSDIIRVEKLSYRFTGLQTNTKYLFRVQAINSRGEGGKWSVEVEEATRFGKFGCVLAATGVGVCCTLAGPLIGLVGGGSLAHDFIVKRTDMKVARISAAVGGAVGGVIVGTVGAPVMGVIAGYEVCKDYLGVNIDISPQTSDDESD